MLKSFLVIAVLATVVQAPPPIPWKAPDNPRRTGPYIENQSNQNQEASKPSTPSSKPIQPQYPNGNGGEQGNENTSNAIIVRELPPVTIAAKHGIDWNAFANYLLVAVGIGGIVVAVYTLCYIRQQAVEMRRQRIVMARSLLAIKRQSGHLERQVTMQESLNQQWIDVDGWRIEGRDHYQRDIPNSLTITFSIENMTNAPFTIQKITAVVAGQTWNSESANTMSQNDGAQEVRVPVRFQPDWETDYRQNRLPLALDGSITFMDYSGNKREQPIGRRFIVGIKYWKDGAFGATDRTSCT